MTSILKADTIQDTDGNNIINESSNTVTIGAAGDTVDVPGTEVKTNKITSYFQIGTANSPVQDTAEFALLL